jgi:hypothetical protein
MFEFQWNGLRVGDRVAVHNDRDDGFELTEGIVHIIEAHPHETNVVAIRVDDGETPVQHPRRHAVHLLPLHGRPPCWRCAVNSAVAESRGQAGWIVAA